MSEGAKGFKWLPISPCFSLEVVKPLQTSLLVITLWKDGGDVCFPEDMGGVGRVDDSSWLVNRAYLPGPDVFAVIVLFPMMLGGRCIETHLQDWKLEGTGGRLTWLDHVRPW